MQAVMAGPATAEADKLAGQAADIAPSAYLYRADRTAEQNPPEAWVLLMQHANLPFDQLVDTKAPAVKQALCGLLWEEVRPVRRLVLSWSRKAKNKPAPDQLVVSCFNGRDDTAHTWWNPRTVKEAAAPEVSADGRTYSYAIPVDTWGVMVAVRGPQTANIEHPTSNIQHPASNIQHPASNIQHRTSNILHPTSKGRKRRPSRCPRCKRS